jgi:hypothetical protein
MDAVRSVQLNDQAAMRLMLKRVAEDRADNLDILNLFVQCRFVPSIDLATSMAESALRNADSDHFSKLISLRVDMSDIMLSVVVSTENVIGLSKISGLLRTVQRPSQDAIDAAIELTAQSNLFRMIKAIMKLGLHPSPQAIVQIMAIPNLSPAISRLFTN